MKFTTVFQQPVFIPGYPFHLGILVDGDMAGPLFFERRYLDINRVQLEVITTPIPVELYGSMLQLSIQDAVLKAAVFVEVSIDSVDNAAAGTGERWAAPAVTVDTMPKFTTMNRDAVKWAGYPLHLGIVVDATMAGSTIYFERRYLDINRQVLDIKSSLVPEESYGSYLQLSVPDEALHCAAFVEVSLQDVDNTMVGYCPGDVIPDVTDGILTEAGDFLLLETGDYLLQE